MTKRVVITQELCRKVEIMLAGAKAPEVAQLLGISDKTVYRIKNAEFDAEKYRKAMEARREPMKKEEKPVEVQVPGQICMELPEKEEKPDMSEAVKMMRFLAGQFDKLYMMMSKINDNVCQAMRKLDG